MDHIEAEVEDLTEVEVVVEDQAKAEVEDKVEVVMEDQA